MNETPNIAVMKMQEHQKSILDDKVMHKTIKLFA